MSFFFVACADFVLFLNLRFFIPLVIVLQSFGSLLCRKAKEAKPAIVPTAKAFLLSHPSQRLFEPIQRFTETTLF